MYSSDKNTNTLYENITTENILSYFLELSKSRILTAVGGGGKTTFLNTLALAFSARREKVLLTTTTHMGRPFFLPKEVAAESEDFSELTSLLAENDLVGLGIPCSVMDGGQVKWRSPSFSFLNKIAADLSADLSCQGDGCSRFPLKILCEGDGSKCLPVKIPREGEPVFFPKTDTVVGLIGLSCFHKPVREVLFRRELLPDAFPDFPAFSENDRIDTDFLYRIALSEKGLKKGVHSERFSVIFNQADLLSGEQLAEICRLADKIRDNGISCRVVSLKSMSV